MREGGRGGSRRPRQAGDRAWEDDQLIELYPPANMEVRLRLNEVVVARVTTGMRVHAVIPSLGDLGVDGTIVEVSGVGRDKYVDLDGEVPPAGVVQYVARVRLDQERPFSDTLRPLRSDPSGHGPQSLAHQLPEAAGGHFNAEVRCMFEYPVRHRFLAGERS